MSSNAFARSRPRVRHQRVPKTPSCDHPRFLQLVNELARLNEIKKKQEEIEGDRCGGGSCSSSSSSSSSSSNVDGVGGGNGSMDDTTAFNNATLPRQSQAIIVDCSEGDGLSYCPNIQSSVVGASCCNDVPQTSNGYRSLDANQLNSALHDHYRHHHHQQQQQNHQGHNHHQSHHHHLNQNQQHHHNHQQHHHHHHHHNQHEEPQSLCNNMQPQHEDRCPGKGSSSSFGYSKQNLVVEQNNSDFSNNNNLDLRQDENRSKRKRPANDSLASSKKNSMPSCATGSGSSKRLKSSSDTVRPLSPSFTKCPICLLDSMDRDPSFTNTCFHLFCYVCIENWTKNKATCPLCRTKFTKIIYSIKSPTNYEEKPVSPVRRDDDDGYMADRLMLEHLSGLNPNSSVTNRNTNSDDVQFLFENLRNPEVLMPQYFVNQMDPRQETLHSFNTVTASSNFTSSVPHPPFTSTSYPMASNYILFQPNRIPPTASTAITGAYQSNTNLTNINNELSNRRTSRSGRYSYRSYESSVVDSSTRSTRTSNSNIVQPSSALERHHHNQHQHQNQHQHHHQTQHRSLDMGHRQSQRMDPGLHIPLPSYPIPPRHYNPSAYTRRYSSNPQEEQHLIDTLSMYRQMPDM